MLPKEIDMLSMIQLSWGILHAVNDINNHNQRLLAYDNASWRDGKRQANIAGSVPPGRRVKRKRVCGTPNNFTSIYMGMQVRIANDRLSYRAPLSWQAVSNAA